MIVALKILFSVKQTLDISTGTRCIGDLALLSDGTAVMCCDFESKLKRYSVQTGAELGCISIRDACRLTEVRFSGKLALAITFRFVPKHKICLMCQICSGSECQKRRKLFFTIYTSCVHKSIVHSLHRFISIGTDSDGESDTFG